MPPKTKISKEMVTNAAYEIVRESGIDNLNARNIANRLHCSTQPVLYCFKNMEEIKSEVYRIADEYHSQFLTQDIERENNPMHALGQNYIRFGYEEKNLFRFLFQSNSFSGQMQGLFDDERLLPILDVLRKQTGVDLEVAKKLFASIYYPIHGIASLLANNAIEYDKDEYSDITNTIFQGMLKELGVEQQ